VKALPSSASLTCPVFKERNNTRKYDSRIAEMKEKHQSNERFNVISFTTGDTSRLDWTETFRTEELCISALV
jgi:hypothetical protein